MNHSHQLKGGLTEGSIKGKQPICLANFIQDMKLPELFLGWNNNDKLTIPLEFEPNQQRVFVIHCKNFEIPGRIHNDRRALK